MTVLCCHHKLYGLVLANLRKLWMIIITCIMFKADFPTRTLDFTLSLPGGEGKVP